MAHLVLSEMELEPAVLKDPCYKYIFTVEDVNNKVMAGIPFREAYRQIGEQVQRGEYQTEHREIYRTHEGSICNLCLSQIRDKFACRHGTWDISTVLEAELQLFV